VAEDSKHIFLESVFMQSENRVRTVDQSALKVNQAFIITLLVLAFIIDSWHLAAFVSLVMLLGTVLPRYSLFKGIYQHLFLSVGLVRSNNVPDNPEPHLFAQGFGGLVLILAVLSLIIGLSVIGWALVWVVIGLAALNLFLGFCAGCFIYYQLNRLHVPGFDHSPIK
jgi:hypothetical protein